MAFVFGDNIVLVAFDHAFERRFGLEVYDAATQLRGHLTRIVLVEIESLHDLLVRHIESNQVQTQAPLAQCLMVSAKIMLAGLAVIAAPLTLPLTQWRVV